MVSGAQGIILVMPQNTARFWAHFAPLASAAVRPQNVDLMARDRFKLGVAGVAFAALGFFACAPAATLPPDVSPEPMPQGGEWQGVYQGPYHIYLRITRVGDHAQGTWRAMGGREGALWGDVDGNVMNFSWSEHDMQSKGTWSGRVYFVYLARQDGTAP